MRRGPARTFSELLRSRNGAAGAMQRLTKERYRLRAEAATRAMLIRRVHTVALPPDTDSYFIGSARVANRAYRQVATHAVRNADHGRRSTHQLLDLVVRTKGHSDAVTAIEEALPRRWNKANALVYGSSMITPIGLEGGMSHNKGPLVPIIREARLFRHSAYRPTTPLHLDPGTSG